MRKKILHIISSTIWRGGEQQVEYMLNAKSDDFEYFLFCPENAELVKRNREKNKNIFTYKKRFGADIFAAIQLKKITKKNQIDLIHLHDSHAINTYILADFIGMNIPAVIHKHTNFSVTNSWKYKHQKIKKIICVSNAVKNQLLSFVDSTKLCVVYPAIELNKFKNSTAQINTNNLKQELAIPTKDKIIGIVSALEKEKYIEEFIEIANKISVQNENFHFVIIGDGSLKTILKNKIVSQKTKFYFLGFRNDIAAILPNFDTFLYTSKNEGFGQVLIEAMAAKVPVVSSNFAAATEIIEDNKNGFIYKNIDDARYKIELLNNDITLRTTIVENATLFVEQFDISLMNKKVETIYHSIFNKENQL